MAKSDDKNLQPKERSIVYLHFHEGSTRNIGYLRGVPYPPSALISYLHVIRTTLNQNKNEKIEMGNVFERRGNDILCELAFIERKLEAIREETLKSMRTGRPLDRSYVDEKNQKIVHSLNDVLRHIDLGIKESGRAY